MARKPVAVGVHDDIADEDGTVVNCRVCGSVFPTRNRLFQHIAKTGHAELHQGASGESGKKTRQRRS